MSDATGTATTGAETDTATGAETDTAAGTATDTTAGTGPDTATATDTTRGTDTTTETTVSVRMYNVGFGDCFVVTVSRGDRVWRMLVDCGVHSQGRAKVDGVSRTIAEVVKAVIADLTAVTQAGSPPRFDVVVATHHHQDHITGFAVPDWETVEVGEVIVPFVEDPADKDARALRNSLVSAATKLNGIIEATAKRKERSGSGFTDALSLANSFAINSMGNAAATDRLLHQNGRHFLEPTHDIFFAPDRDPAKNVLPTPIDGVNIHILGPSRDPKQLSLMNPPASAEWLQLDPDQGLEDDDTPALFPAIYVVPDDEHDELPDELTKARASLRLSQLATSDEALLGAAAVLERSVNNTSVYFVLDVAGTRLLFVGDSQEGAWEHVLGDAESRELVSNVAFYKIGHHGSHNATPKSFVDSVLGDGAYAMLPWGLVKKWADTIPKAELLAALAEHKTHLIRADAPVADTPQVEVGPGQLWSQVTFTVP